MSNETSTPELIELLASLRARVEALERQPTAWTRGDIKLWYRAPSDLPTGWWPCDGTVAPDGVTTPDLRGRFPVGLNPASPAFDTLGETGGAATIDLQHQHGDAHQHDVEGVTQSVAETGSPDGEDLDTTVNLTHGGTDQVARQLHTHHVLVAGTVSQDVTTTGAALSTAQSIMPPYTVVTFAYRYL